MILQRRFIMSLTAILCATASILALLLHILNVLPMYFFIDSVAAPSLVLLLALGVFARRINESVFVNRLATGAWVGLLATLAYDLIRFPIWKSDLIDFNPFFTNQIFGTIITGLPPESFAAIIVGWAYHYWNGFGFGIIYSLLAGPARWYYGVVWAIFLEAGWLLALPSALQFKLGLDLVVVSLIGHAAYGTVLGLASRKFAKA